MANTIAILEQGGNSDTAAVYAFEYVNGGKTDWHLPSKDELNELWKYKVIAGGFVDAAYWSSSEFDVPVAWTKKETLAWFQHFASGNQRDDTKTYGNLVRPVRAF